MNSDPLLREQMDAELAARLARMTARNPRTSSGTSTPPSSPPLATRQLASSPPPPPPPGAGPTRKKRRHPARHSRSAALALSFITTSGLAYAFAATDNSASATVTAPAGLVGASQPVAAPATTAAAPATTAPVAATSAPTTAPATTAPATTAAPATPTVVNGASVRNRYGNVQIQATFAADGTLTNVDVLEAPSRDGQSVQINNYAVPRLNSEALVAQSANVHTVSGATYTSIGYAQSLQSAIDVARANGLTTIS